MWTRLHHPAIRTSQGGKVLYVANDDLYSHPAIYSTTTSSASSQPKNLPPSAPTYSYRGWMGPLLGYNTERKVLAPAFSITLNYLFILDHVAGIMTLMGTAEYFKMDDLAGKVGSAVASATLDK